MKNSLLPIERPTGNYYAIELEETIYKTIKDTDEISEITFKWDTLIDSLEHPVVDLTIQVAQAKPQSDKIEVKDLVKAINQTKSLQYMDRIFGLRAKEIEKIGYINIKEVQDHTTVKLSINWINESSLKETPISVFRNDDEIQKLKVQDLKKIEKQYGYNIQKIYDQLPVLPDETNKFNTYKTIEQNIFIEDARAKYDQGGEVTLFYGTNRTSTLIKDKNQTYGNNIAELEQGICQVTIPRGHVQGKLERPTDFFLFKFPENKSRHIMVQEVIPMDRDSFITYFNNTIKNKKEKNALLFVHGYRTSFEEAARRSGQLAWDLQFEGFSGFFSWPSAAKYADYLSDEAKARSSFPALEQFLKELILNTDLEHVHIIAHSMGSLVTTLSLNSLRRDESMVEHLKKIKQLILGAPDIDQEEFRNTILPEFKNVGLRRTIYASDHDSALMLSSWGRRDRLRLGQIGKDIFIDQDVDTIEASNLETNSSHNYLFESKLLLSDLFYLITKDLDPSQRRLREIKRKKLAYWLFPE